MKKISVASIPSLFDPVAINRSRNKGASVACHGQTAKLHSRAGGLQDERQGTRVRKESLMPPIPSQRSSPSYRKTSTPRGPDGRRPNSPADQEYDQNNNQTGLKVVGETGYLPLNSRKKSTAEKIGDTGFLLYTMDDSNKLPQILKPKRKVSKGSKRKKMSSTVDPNNNSVKESLEDDMKSRLQVIEENKGNPENEEGELYNKYGLDLKRDFNMEMTRPFTFSYFPKVIPIKKNDAGKKNLRKISKVGMKAPLS